MYFKEFFLIELIKNTFFLGLKMLFVTDFQQSTSVREDMANH